MTLGKYGGVTTSTSLLRDWVLAHLKICEVISQFPFALGERTRIFNQSFKASSPAPAPSRCRICQDPWQGNSPSAMKVNGFLEGASAYRAGVNWMQAGIQSRFTKAAPAAAVSVAIPANEIAGRCP
jgi:hypothetical protein